MTPKEHAYVLFAGIASILLLASAIGFTLKIAVARGAPNALIDNLNARIKAWWLIAFVTGLSFLAGRSGVVLLFALISFQALREYVSAIATRISDHWALIAAFFVVIPVQYALVWAGESTLAALFIPVCTFILVPILAARGGDIRNFLQSAATIHWGLMVSVYCLSHVPMLLDLDMAGTDNQKIFLPLFLILVVQLSDVTQYIWGKLLGKHRIAPSLSPSKTVEGFAGGMASATLLGSALWWMTPLTPLEAGLVSFAVALMGFFGGLVMSAIKRDRGQKDWGAMIQGHGGILDRVDSLCFSAPVFFYLMRFWTAS